MRPSVRFVSDKLIEDIVSEASNILCTLGVEIHNKNVLDMLSSHGCKVRMDNSHAVFTHQVIQKSLQTVPHSFKMFDSLGNQTHDFSGFNVYFTPGSTALNILDSKSRKMRNANTGDYIHFVKVTDQLEHIAALSTAIISADVPQQISDSYRLFLSLLYSKKPVVTGAFTIESFEAMKDFQVAIRKSEKALREKPLTIFSICPTSPLKWSEVTSQNLLDCARYFIPVEFIAMPLSGFIAPVTLVGTLIQHTAETLSGVVISQLASPGCPVLYGGSPAIFDIRCETTPMGAIETMMIDCAYNEIGKFLKIPTQAYISLSDAKQLDAQAGLESGLGAALAALSGINSVSGPGMLDFESCLSLEKLVLDNEICGMSYRMIAGIEPKEDFPALPIFQELLTERNLIISDHTRKYIKSEIYTTGPVIDRKNRSRWERDGSLTLFERANAEVNKLLKSYEPYGLPEDTRRQLIKLMEAEARRYKLGALPVRPQ